MIRRFRDWRDFAAFKEGTWPLSGSGGKIYYHCAKGNTCISDDPRLYEKLVQTVEHYYRDHDGCPPGTSFPGQGDG
jgi:hypothetical protein